MESKIERLIVLEEWLTKLWPTLEHKKQWFVECKKANTDHLDNIKLFSKLKNLRQNGCNEGCVMTAQTDLSERGRAISRLVESVKDLVIFIVNTIIDFMMCKIAPPKFFQNPIVGVPP